ncbi:MAG: alpha/beta hydrolase [Sneathiellaceae bacterium]
MTDFFPGFETRRIEIAGIDFFLRTGGSGPPLLLLHGYPQTHVCWHRIAPALAAHFTVVLPDVRGYGATATPPGMAMDKRASAADQVALMAALGHDRFALAGHDRGGRIAYRLALDHPAAVDRLVTLDIVPTHDTWAAMGKAEALRAYHWPFLAQPEPLPERLFGADPDFYVDWTIRSWCADPDAIDPAAMAAYRAAFRSPAAIHFACEDYRAGAGIDDALDAADKAAGRRIACPMLALWGAGPLKLGGADLAEVWRRDWAVEVRGHAIASGHFLQEEAPDAVLQALLPFLLGDSPQT